MDLERPSREAWRFGFGGDTPGVFKFDPTDADIVAHYLLPRALGLPIPYAHAVIDGDPSSLPPWDVLRRHGHDGGCGHAFFFGPPPDAARNGGRRCRAVSGGTWQGQKNVDGTVTLRRPGGGEVDVRYRRYNLTFYAGNGKRPRRGGGEGCASTGFVMHEYEITSPPLPGTVLTRIKVTNRGRDLMELQDQQQQQQATAAPVAAAAAVDQQVVAVPEQPGPIYYPAVAPPGDDRAEAFFGAAGQAFPLYGDNGGGAMVEAGAYYDPPPHLYVQDGGGAGEYSDGYGHPHEQPFPWPYQLDPSYQYHHAAGINAASVDAGEGCSHWQQNGAHDAYDDNGGGTGETGASLCSASAATGDDDCDVDDNSFYQALFGDDDVKIEQNDGSDPATDQG